MLPFGDLSGQEFTWQVIELVWRILSAVAIWLKLAFLDVVWVVSSDSTGSLLSLWSPPIPYNIDFSNPGLLPSSSRKGCLSNLRRLSFTKHTIVIKNDILSPLLCSIVYREVKVLHTSNTEKLHKSMVSKSHLKLCHIHICASKHVC